MDVVLTVWEVARYLRLSRTTVWRWCREGKLRAVRIGHQWRVRRAEVERMIDRDRSALDEQEQETRHA